MWNAKTYQGPASKFEQLEALDLRALENQATALKLADEDAKQIAAATAAATAIVVTLPEDTHVQVNAHGHGHDDAQPCSVIQVEVTEIPAPREEMARSA